MGTGPLRRLGSPQPVAVSTDDEGVPAAVVIDGRERSVVSVREDWLVQDLWWTENPVDRRYFELVLDPGRHAVVFRDRDGAWSMHG